MKTFRIVAFSIVAVLILITIYWSFNSIKPIDFNTQIKPILNKKCIACHGGVKREGEFSLLFRQEAIAKSEFGKFAIVPGDPQHSELIHRITSTDAEQRMPYKKDPLTSGEIDLLRQWIEEGAPWGDHWAYVKVAQQPTPQQPIWAKNEIDGFIHQKLEENDLEISSETEKEVLLRRISLDLTGLPAPASIAATYLNGKRENAYEQLVDSLLASPHFGERWASVWMDLARYADTKGYERDDGRKIWRYRDWLIKAFNADMPYDSFLIHQLAGDLLPHPSDAHYIATAFHRNTMTNDEGGTDNEEFRTAAVLDRVNTTWEVLMGTTFACVQCHSHPYDPFRHEEYYKFMAFFNNTRDEDTYDDYPLLKHFEAEDEEKIKALKSWIENQGSKEKADETYAFLKTGQPAINSLTADEFRNSELSDTKWLVFRNNGVCRLKAVDLTAKNKMIYRFNGFKSGGVWTVHLDHPNGPILKKVNPLKTKGWSIAEMQFDLEANGKHDLYLTYTNSHLQKPEENGVLFDWFYLTDGFFDAHPQEKKEYWTLLSKNTPTTPIMVENPESMQRVSHVFERGNWLVRGDTVQPDVPASLNPFPKNAPRNRHGLALWMVDKENPLTARTLVNRVWEQIFGSGLVETLEDMGTQGNTPTHPQLLDHLSWKLMHEYGWSVKKLIREIVTSATYRQDSKVTPDKLEKDPFNKFYARSPRVRLSAEQIRDQALAVSGLLNEKLYGPSVMPYQPEGIWLSPWNGQSWKKSGGDEQHRRALYIYWKRTAPYPSMMTFDGSAREVCTARRIRTNTPLQALVTLNDSVYVEAAHHLALRMLKEERVLAKQIEKGYEVAIGRPISKSKRHVLENLYYSTLNKVDIKPVGQSKQEQPFSAEQRAMTLVANAILNLDEFVTKN